MCVFLMFAEILSTSVTHFSSILARIGTRELPARSYSETHATFPLHLHHVGDGHGDSQSGRPTLCSGHALVSPRPLPYKATGVAIDSQGGPLSRKRSKVSPLGSGSCALC